jgi:hypothetical protein
MIAEAVGAGLELVGGWLDCAFGVVRRLGAPLLGTSPPAVAPADMAPKPAPRPPAGPHAEVEEAKYWLAPEPPRPRGVVVDREPGELPRSYGRDRIVLLPRDPWWAFAYWEVTPATRVRALRALGAEGEGAREVLRAYDVTFLTFTGDNAWLSFDIEVIPGTDRWYLNLGRPAAAFCVELGLRTPGGRFLPLVRSNVINTPRSSPSQDTTVRWVELGSGPPREAARAWTGDRLPEAGGNGAGHSGPSSDSRARSSDVHAPPAR